MTADRSRTILARLLLAAALLGGCSALESVIALTQVDFALAGARHGVLAGIDLDRVRSVRDLAPGDVLRAADAVRRGRLPFSVTLDVAARNPAANDVDARLERLDWTLFLEGRETVSGTLRDNILLPAGREVTIPLRVELDLMRFFDDNAQDLLDLALRVAGAGGEPKDVRLTARPTVRTPLGPITYPGDIEIASRRLGATAAAL